MVFTICQHTIVIVVTFILSSENWLLFLSVVKLLYHLFRSSPLPSSSSTNLFSIIININDHHQLSHQFLDTSVPLPIFASITIDKTQWSLVINTTSSNSCRPLLCLSPPICAFSVSILHLQSSPLTDHHHYHSQSSSSICYIAVTCII